MKPPGSAQAPPIRPNLPPVQPRELEPEAEQEEPYVYVIGKIMPRFPNLGVEKEFVRETSGADTADLTAFRTVLAKPQNRYLFREMLWVLTTGDVDACILLPREPSDLHLLLESVRPEPRATDLDLVIGTRGAPQMCSGVLMQTVIFDQIYSFDIDSLLDSVPRRAGMTAAEFRPAAEELFNSMITAARGGCGGNADRALFFSLHAILGSIIWPPSFEWRGFD